MSLALCAPAAHNGVRILRNPDATLKRQLRTRNRGKILSAVREILILPVVARIG